MRHRRRTFVMGAACAALLPGFAAPAPAVDPSCQPSDFDGDGITAIDDLLLLLAGWGDPWGVDDLLDLLVAWSPAGQEGGVFPATWINGGDCPDEGPFQVHQYNEDTYILRQALCTNFEAPFIYLLFGADKVLMEDTGAAGGAAIGPTVYGIIDQWLTRRGQVSIQLVVAHSHGHGDHIANDGQFTGQPDTTVVGTSVAAVRSFFGISDWPSQIVEYDLGGGRVVDVIPIPGHQSAHIVLYDRRTGLLLTGDTLYAGRLYIFDFNAYVESIQRLVDFVAAKPGCRVLGTHIEMSNTPGVDFPLGSLHHPDEHPLELDRSHLQELLDGVLGMQGDPHIEVHDEFIIFPF